MLKFKKLNMTQLQGIEYSYLNKETNLQWKDYLRPKAMTKTCAYHQEL